MACRSYVNALIVLAVAAKVYYLGPLFCRLWRLAQVEVSPEDKAPDALRLGLMGVGFIAEVAAVYPAGKRRDVVVTAVASRDADKAAAFAAKHGVPIALSGAAAYEDLLRREDVDAVYICLPTQLHAHWALAALSAGKHVLLEKPAAMNAVESGLLAAAAERSGSVFFEAAHHRFHPADVETQRLLRERVGALEHLETRFSLLALRPSKASRDVVRRKSLDRWWYCADVLLWMSGATSWVVRSAVEHDLAVEGHLELSVPSQRETVSAYFSMSREQLWPPFQWSFSGRGSNGSVALSNVGFPWLFHTVSSEQGPAAAAVRTDSSFYGDRVSTFEYQLEAFMASVRSGVSGATAQQAHLTARLVDDILQAAGTGPLPSETTAQASAASGDR